MRNSIVGILCFAGFCITGCGTGEDQDLPEEGTRSNQTYAAGGSKWGCKTCGFSNVPIWGTREVDTATYGSGSSQTLPSYALLIDPSGDGWDVTFEKGELVATNGVDDVRGHDLIGWRLLAKWPDGDEMEAEIY